MSEIILSTHGLSKYYGITPAVNSVDITIRKGDIYGFVGKNGAGKTTFMRIISGLIMPTSGSYELLGASSSDTPALCSARRKLCSIIEQPALYLNMNAADNMKQQCLIYDKSYKKIRDLLDMVELSNVGNKDVKNFSLGMKQRLGLAMSLVTEPKFMLLDEPTNGLDPDGIQKIRHMLVRANKEHGVTIMVSSHILGELKLFATRFGFIHAGKLINEISSDELAKKARPATELQVSDPGKALLVLKTLGLECTINGGGVVVAGEFDITDAILALKEHDVTLLNMTKGTFDLEKYFIDLINRPHTPSAPPVDPFADTFGGDRK